MVEEFWRTFWTAVRGGLHSMGGKPSAHGKALWIQVKEKSFFLQLFVTVLNSVISIPSLEKT